MRFLVGVSKAFGSITLRAMPFAGYKNFEDCVQKNQKKRNPKAYCAEIQRRSEKPKPKKKK